jgi:hypothetical protein
MKISEFINTPKNLEGTRSSATTYSGSKGDQTQDIVPQDIVGSHPDHSAIAEGVSQIFRRQKGKAPTKGFRCTSGPRKGRIVASPSTCFAKVDPSKGAKIKKKRMMKAKTTGKKLAITKRSGQGSGRLKGVQIKQKKGSQPRHGKSRRTGARPLMKSRTVKVKK